MAHKHTPGHLRLKGKRCLIAGAASEPGVSIALIFALEGSRVQLLETNPSAVRSLTEQIKESGGLATVCQGNLPDFDGKPISELPNGLRIGAIDIVVDARLANPSSHEQDNLEETFFVRVSVLGPGTPHENSIVLKPKESVLNQCGNQDISSSLAAYGLQVAYAALFLASDEAASVHNSLLLIS